MGNPTLPSALRGFTSEFGKDQVVHSCYGRQHNCLWILAWVLLDAEAFSKSVTDWAELNLTLSVHFS